MKPKLSILLLLIVFSVTLVNAEELDETKVVRKKIELSFGTSQMLVDEVNRSDIKSTQKVVLPTTGALLIAEYLWSETWGSLFAFNLPLVTQKFIVGGELIEESAAKTFMIGQRYTPVDWHMTKSAILSPQFSLLLSTMVGEKVALSPSVAGRLHIRDESGFSMYMGGTLTYAIKGYVLFYGIGHRF